MSALSREVILDRAIDILATDRSTSLGEIARRIGIGRTSLHRHYPDRAALLLAVSREGVARIDAAFERADLRAGTGLEAILRACAELFRLGSVLTLALMEPPLVTDESWEEPPEVGIGFATVVDRGQQDGSIDPTLDAGWIEVLMWTTLAAGQLQARRPDVTSRQALELVIGAVRRAVGRDVVGA